MLYMRAVTVDGMNRGGTGGVKYNRLFKGVIQDAHATSRRFFNNVIIMIRGGDYIGK